MPAVVRRHADHHIGHSSVSVGPFHKTFYAQGSPNVFLNFEPIIRKGDPLACGDRAQETSPDVYANNILVHRKGDLTSGHGSWPPVPAETGSPDVYANGF